MHFKVLYEYPSANDLRDWRAALAEAEYASHYTSPSFFREPYFIGRSPFAVLAYSGSEVQGIACGVVDGNEAVCGLMSRSQVCFRQGADVDAVGRVLADGMATLPQRLLTVYSGTASAGFLARRFRQRTYEGSQGTRMLRLGRTADEVFKGFSATVRNEVRRAIKIGVEVAHMDIESEFDQYYDIYVEWCQHKRIAPIEREVQRASYSLTTNRIVLVAKFEGRMVGVSTFRFCEPGVVEYTANVSRHEDRKLRPNGLLVWRGVEWACERGFSWFSMGGNHFFLSQFGGEVSPIFRYRLDRSLGRRHDVEEYVRERAGNRFRSLSPAWQSKIRRLLGKGEDVGEASREEEPKTASESKVAEAAKE